MVQSHDDAIKFRPHPADPAVLGPDDDDQLITRYRRTGQMLVRYRRRCDESDFS
jgi:hypothetical protein